MELGSGAGKKVRLLPRERRPPGYLGFDIFEDQWFDFHAGESIHTVDAYQCAVESFGRLAGPVGWGQEPVWTDPNPYLAFNCCVPAVRKMGRMLPFV